MNLRDVIMAAMANRGAPNVPYGGRAGGVNPGLRLKPVAGVRTSSGAPLKQQDYGVQVSDVPSLPPEVLASALRGGSGGLGGASGPVGYPPTAPQVQPYAPPSIPGSELPGIGAGGTPIPGGGGGLGNSNMPSSSMSPMDTEIGMPLPMGGSVNGGPEFPIQGVPWAHRGSQSGPQGEALRQILQEILRQGPTQRPYGRQ